MSSLEQSPSQGGIWTYGTQNVTSAQSSGRYYYYFTNSEACTSIDSIEISHQTPDYVASLAIAPSAINGPSQVRTIVSISEVNDEFDCSPVYVLIPKDNGRYNFFYLPNALNVGGISVDNADWQYYSSNPTFHVWEYVGGDFPALGTKKLGLLGAFDPNNSDGQTSFTVQLYGGSGGEVNGVNNSDSESLLYFK